MVQDPYKYFRQEAAELLEQFARDVLELERGGGAPLVPRLLRLAHTLKGAARVVRQPAIADRAHAIEDLLAPHRGGAVPPPSAIAGLRAHLDEIAAHARALAPPEPAPSPAAPAPEPHARESHASAGEPVRTVRADIGDVDLLLHGVAEAHALLGGIRASADAMEHEQHLADLLVAQLAPRPGADRAPASPALAVAEELRACLARRGRTLGLAGEQMERELLELRDAAEQLRLVPAEALFGTLDRTAHDTARDLGRAIAFAATGAELRIDAHVLAAVQGALVQLVRNAVAHGIESPAARRAAGKPPAGRIEIAAARRGRRIIFECRDDGGGLDFEAVRRIARQRGLLGAEAQATRPQDLLALLLRGGISTASTVTELSGRGVGLDVVRAAMAQLGGEVSAETEPGRFTLFRLAVPSSLASTEVLKVGAGGSVVCIPLAAIRRTAHLPAAEIGQTPAGATIAYAGAAIPFLPLASVLRGAPPPAGRGWTALVLAGAEGPAAIGVDRMLGIARAVVRPLPPHTAATPVVAGAVLDAEGTPQIVLDPDALAAAAHRGTRVGFAEPKPRRPVLVIDDSLTTRMLEQSILESAGYEVDVALSGEEGLAAARRRRYALFLVDVEMPGMDGFGFIERVRADPVLHDIPAILVTSRVSPEDRQRGRTAGAQDHIAKSDFDQTRLLAKIRELVA